ncbi:MAG: protoporphyrinogen oxidase [Acidobacteriaceae bacterium]
MIAIAGAGLSGLATAYQLACDHVPFTLFEAGERLGGIVETVHRQGFVIECGPDSWVTEKPWARELAVELGLEDQIISSNDQWRRTYVQQEEGRQTRLVPIPDGMQMMIPAKWGPLLESPLFSWQARLAYLREPKRAAELKASAPTEDESVADFVRRHFGGEVASKVAGPLLAAVFGGDIEQLSVRAVMQPFVRMEAEQGSLIQAMQARTRESAQSIFTTLSSGLETLIERMAKRLPAESVRLRRPVLRIEQDQGGWRLTSGQSERNSETSRFDAVVLATPPDVTAMLLRQLNPRIAALLPQRATSAIVAALAFAPEQASRLRIPRGFGYVVPSGSSSSEEHKLLACTFVDQKFPGRVPQGAVLLRAFFGGHSGEVLQGEGDDQIAERARRQLARVLGPLPQAAETVVRRWPLSLPQYEVGHLDRMAELQRQLNTVPALHLVGSAYYGVGLPDLIRQGRATARLLVKQSQSNAAQKTAV